MPLILLEAAGHFLVGMATGLFLTLVVAADETATRRCARSAQWRVDRLRAEADRRVQDVYWRYAPAMGADVRQAYELRLGVW